MRSSALSMVTVWTLCSFKMTQEMGHLPGRRWVWVVVALLLVWSATDGRKGPNSDLSDHNTPLDVQATGMSKYQRIMRQLAMRH